MFAKHLLHWEDKFGTAVRFAAAAIGFLVVLYGAADITVRAAAEAGSFSNATIFGPAVVLTAASGNSNPQLSSVATTTPLIPVLLKIPAIGVSATIESVGKNDSGAMATPKKFTDAAWYSIGPKPGESGSAVIDGHVNNALTTAGVFLHLSNLKVGDYITVTDTTGRTLVYAVTETALYDSSTAPLDKIFSSSGPSELVLITCEGDWVPSEHSFNKRLVVYAGLTSK